MKCFISHNFRDKQKAEHLSRELLRQGLEVWLDKWDVFAGESLTSKIEEGIQGSSVFVILLSSNSVKANWVKEELRIALQRRLKDPDFKLIPILLEDCNIPAFLEDYVYISWRNGDADPIPELLRAIKGVSLRPEYVARHASGGITYKKVLHSLAMRGNKGDLTHVTENFDATATSNLSQIDRGIHYAGKLAAIQSDLFTIEQIYVNPQYQKWVLHPQKQILVNSGFTFSIDYTLGNTFENDEELWFYTVEAPTDRLIVVFDFRETDTISDMKCFHRQGQTLLPEETKPTLDGRSWIWEKLFPEYKDTYEFHFSWDKF